MIINLSRKCHAANVDHCYSDIGCFPLSAEFYHPRHRPFNVRPWHRRRIRTSFQLYSRRHPDGFRLEPWNPASLAESQFDPLLETKIIIPGWLDNAKRALWVRRLRDALLWLWKPCNIILVEWRNFTPYTIATANTRVVGAELANLLSFIERQLNYDRLFFHLIGHSLGAHISGYCGDRLPGLGRITALDPARPFFQHMPKSVRLDREDARFVDAIHSDFTPENAIFLIMSFGMTTPVGHLDFYPNGPQLLQPGCLRDSLQAVRLGVQKGLEHNSLQVAFLESVRYLTACDHQRAHQWFTESLTNRQCLFVGLRCDHFEGMINGRCSCADSRSACAIMGIHADQMYLSGLHDEFWPSRWPTEGATSGAGLWLPLEADLGRLKAEALKLALPAKPNMLDEFPLQEFESLEEDKLFYEYLQTRFRNHSWSQGQRWEEPPEWPAGGQPSPRSRLEGELEHWYEHSSRWHLRTGSRPNFCLNQYQLLLFVGALSAPQKLKANLLVSIEGSRGRLLNQRLEPRDNHFYPHTMQPFFLVLEDGFSLGQLFSVALAWEPKKLPSAALNTDVSFLENELDQEEPLAAGRKWARRLSAEWAGNSSSAARESPDGLKRALQVDELLLQPLEEFIVIKRLVLSPLEANYGRRPPAGEGVAARLFCPANSNFRLQHSQTMRLLPSLLPRCQQLGRRRAQAA